MKKKDKEDKNKKKGKNNKVLIILSCILIGIVILCSCFLFVTYKSLKIKVTGKEKVTVEVGEKYTDKGATATVFGKKITNKIKVKGKVSNEKIGTYKVQYSVHYLFFDKKKTRTVKVVDTEAPVITLKGKNEVSIYVGEDYTEEGYEVSDNYDKDLDKKVKVTSNVDKEKEGTYEILYEVEDSSHNKASVTRKVTVEKKPEPTYSSGGAVSITYIRGILLVNKKYHLPANYNPGVDPTAWAALTQLRTAANALGYPMEVRSGFRSYSTQNTLYWNYVARDGEAAANMYSAKPGQSEHQTGLAFDVGYIDSNFGNTPDGQWLAANAHKYGFIIRYLPGKEHITGYVYEPWHIRYVGVDAATDIYNRGITLEEYLGVA